MSRSLVILIGIQCCVSGCVKEQKPRRSNSDLCKELEGRTALTLPQDAIIEKHGDGGRSGDNYYHWVVRSKNAIAFPGTDKCNIVGDNAGYDSIKDQLQGKDIGRQVQEGCRSAQWIGKNNAKCRSWTIVTDRGYYTEIEEFR